MQITVLQENLVPVLQTIKRLLAAKPQVPILACVLVEAKDGKIFFSATDLFMGAKVGVLGTIEKEGSVAIPAKALNELITSLKPGKLEISYQDSMLTLSSARNVTKLQVFSPEEYPAFPEPGETAITLPTSLLQTIENTLSFAVSKDETRPLLNTILLKLGGESHLVATDGFRLAFRQENLAVDDTSILFPARALAEIVKLATADKVAEVVLALSPEFQQVYCQIGEAQLHVRLLDGEFPPYQKILPTQFTGEVLLDAEELQQVLKTAAIFTRDSSKIVTLELGENELQVSATSPALGTHQGSMPLKRLTGEPLKIAFNVQYILEFLQRCGSSGVLLKTNDSLDPAVLTPEDDPAFMYVIMPFKLQQAE